MRSKCRQNCPLRPSNLAKLTHEERVKVVKQSYLDIKSNLWPNNNSNHVSDSESSSSEEEEEKEVEKRWFNVGNKIEMGWRAILCK